MTDREATGRMRRVCRMKCHTLPSRAWICVVLSAAVVRAGDAGDFIRLMNLGKAYLENRESAKAIETLNEAVKLDPKSVPAWRNFARAHLIAGKPDAALEALAKAEGVQPVLRDSGQESAATSYLIGLCHIHASRFEQAIPPLVAAVRLDAQTVAMRFQLASAYQAAGQH